MIEGFFDLGKWQVKLFHGVTWEQVRGSTSFAVAVYLAVGCDVRAACCSTQDISQLHGTAWQRHALTLSSPWLQSAAPHQHTTEQSVASCLGTFCNPLVFALQVISDCMALHLL
jgi:hypothetical protein